ncbi:uncharacterized protein LACBIDRAFT_325985 [Laccaria bicolor S238N-H82]|uniref:Predicted protein n=1 Tax=Laccaria bicolor (strain S238N-H82 / ATCC MYA-4686) TaxID=486041 RepID=B0D6W8_LACBS|nr:uncharacterized protein LACBIDRAFT_325985 [Laccaria bicolor S238N-H82]EDR09549.1 predicted protein [Laccaria bicolor S238N-H82]|eukprot:XP_001879898.1 predicted protein [Laccaria bicolor S238N-H82]
MAKWIGGARSEQGKWPEIGKYIDLIQRNPICTGSIFTGVELFALVMLYTRMTALSAKQWGKGVGQVSVGKEGLLRDVWWMLRLITLLPLLEAGFEWTCRNFTNHGCQVVADLDCLENVWESKAARRSGTFSDVPVID